MPFDEELYDFSICVFKSRYVLLTGGSASQVSPDCYSATFVFDLKAEKWMTEPLPPNLNTARCVHGSCTTSMSVFVYGGIGDDIKDLSSIEHMVFD